MYLTCMCDYSEGSLEAVATPPQDAAESNPLCWENSLRLKGLNLAGVDCKVD